MKRSVTVFVGAATLLLTACRGTITERLDVHPNGSATASVTSLMDEEFYNLANQPGRSSDFFKPDEGWSVVRSTDDEGNHKILATKEIPSLSHGDLGALPRQLAPLAADNSLDQENAGFMTRTRMHFVVPAISYPQSGPEDSSFGKIGEALAASLVKVRLELKVPGNVKETNGERLSDGSYRWDLSFDSPTRVDLTTETVNIVFVIGAATLALIIAGLAFAALRPRRSAT